MIFIRKSPSGIYGMTVKSSYDDNRSFNGLKVTKLIPGSPAADYLAEGDVITQVNYTKLHQLNIFFALKEFRRESKKPKLILKITENKAKNIILDDVQLILKDMVRLADLEAQFATRMDELNSININNSGSTLEPD
ncbi:uncharacterized protein LOC129224994 [Uloborus diversus]|uniref:uncharacterized protein LOC129224994 n=1 Tax=Uloborus diversus TaxID=327109 RepID=UPI002409C0BA|nr:uncharacterized protein LOC129224994 [Uloborus diversus]